MLKSLPKTITGHERAEIPTFSLQNKKSIDIFHHVCKDPTNKMKSIRRISHRWNILKCLILDKNRSTMWIVELRSLFMRDLEKSGI